MRKPVLLLLTLAVLLSCTLTVSHAATDYAVSLAASAPASVSPGEDAEISVSVDPRSTAGLYTLNFSLHYDVTRFTFVSASCNAPTGWTFHSNAKNGTVYVISEAAFGGKGYYNPVTDAAGLSYTFRFTATSVSGEAVFATVGNAVATEATASLGLLYASPFSVPITVQEALHLTVSQPLSLQNGILSGVEPGSAPAQIAALCQNSDSIVFTDADGVSVPHDSDRAVGTGWTIALTDATGAVLDSAVVLVSGDLNGNGIHDSNDCALLRNAFLGKTALSDIASLAADQNGNGVLDSNDYIRIRLSILSA